MIPNRKAIRESLEESEKSLKDMSTELERQKRAIDFYKSEGEDVSDLEEMHTLLTRMHGIAERRLRNTGEKAGK